MSDEPEDVENIENVAETDTQQVVKYSINRELQVSILHNALCDRSFFVETLPIVQPEYFEDRIHTLIYRIAIDYFKGKYSTAQEEHKGGFIVTRAVIEQKLAESFPSEQREEYIRSLIELDNVYSLHEERAREREFLVEEVKRFAKKQAMMHFIFKCADLVTKNEETGLTEKDYDVIEKMMQETLMVGTGQALGSFYFEDAKARYDNIPALDENVEKFTCVFKTVDNDLRGGMARKEIACVFAGPGVGKSVFLANVARLNIMKGRNVLYITLEVSEDITQERLDAGFTHIPYGRLYMNRETVLQRLEDIGSHFSESLVVKQFPGLFLTINELRSYIVQLWTYKGWKPDIVIIDYMDEMCPIKGLDEYESQQRIMRQLRSFAVQENICVFTATQTNRAGRQTKIATETEVGDSFGKVRVVDAMWSLNQSDDERLRNIMVGYAVKHRNARSRYKIFIKVDYETLTMEEITENEFGQITSGVPVQTSEVDIDPDSGESTQLPLPSTAAITPNVLSAAMIDAEKQQQGAPKSD